MNEATFGLVLPFDSDDPEFTRGVQVGMVWERVQQTGQVVDQLVYASNAEMIMRVAEAKGLRFTAEDCGDDFWITVTIGPESTAFGETRNDAEG